MTIRRLRETDAQRVRDFLANLFQQDLETGGIDAPLVDFLIAQIRGGLATWVCIEGGKLLGILGPAMAGSRAMPEGNMKTFVHFNRLAVDHTLYKTSKSEAIRVARELTVAAADDIQASGKLPDGILVTGPTASRGASWCRLLGFEEQMHGDESRFWLPFNLIWERCKATEAL